MGSPTPGMTIPDAARLPEARTADECVLLIEGSAHDAASILDELASEPQDHSA